jgi:DnaJ-class molecular chaperone
MAYETRPCLSCEGGIAWSCGNAPEGRRETSPCARCNGSGVVVVFIYERRA